MKTTAQIIFNRTCWTDNKLCSISMSGVKTATKMIAHVWDSGICTSEYQAMSRVIAHVKKWNHGRFYFTNMQSKNGARNTISNNAIARDLQVKPIESLPNIGQKASMERNGYKASNGVTYWAIEKGKGAKNRRSNTGIRYDNPCHKSNPTKSDYRSNYQSGDAWKWDRQNPNDPTSEYVM